MSRVRRRVLVVVLAVLAITIVLAAGAGWYLLGEERRLGRLVAGVVAARTGLAVSVDRAAVDGRRLSLAGVRVRPTAGFPLDVRIGRLTVAGGVLPLVFPAGRRVDVTATATSVAVGAGGGAQAPDAAALERVRTAARGLLDWAGAWTVTVADAALGAPDGRHRFDLTGEKTATGALVIVVVRGDAAPALRLDLRLTPAADGEVDAAVDLAGTPAALAALWPSAWPRPATVAVRGDARLAHGGVLTVNARATAGAAADPVVLDVASRYDGGRGELAVSRWALAWGPDVALDGTARVVAGAAGRVEVTATGAVGGGRLEGRAVSPGRDGGVDADLTLAPVDAARLARRLGVAAPAVSAGRLRIHAAGTLAARWRASIDATATGVAAPSLPPLDAAVVGMLGGEGAGAAAVERATLTIRHAGVPLAVITAASRGAGPWPLAVDARVDDVARLAPLLPGAALAGTARVTGDVTAPRGAPEFAGRVEARIDRGALTSPAPVEIDTLRASLPLAWRGALAPGAAPGRLEIARLGAHGLVLTDVTSSVTIDAGRLVLPDLRYRHYGGQGGGRVEVTPSADGAPLLARLGGNGVDLARVVEALGTHAARVTGRVGYTLTASAAPGQGLTATMQVASEPGGGEIAIDAIERLLTSAPVEAESSGILRQTLQNLRVFEYATLAGDVRWSRGAGHLDLALRGRKRLGIFPAPVEAINLTNVPLAVLAGTLTKGTAP